MFSASEDDLYFKKAPFFVNKYVCYNSPHHHPLSQALYSLRTGVFVSRNAFSFAKYILFQPPSTPALSDFSFPIPTACRRTSRVPRRHRIIVVQATSVNFPPAGAHQKGPHNCRSKSSVMQIVHIGLLQTKNKRNNKPLNKFKKKKPSPPGLIRLRKGAIR